MSELMKNVQNQHGAEWQLTWEQHRSGSDSSRTGKDTFSFDDNSDGVDRIDLTPLT